MTRLIIARQQFISCISDINANMAKIRIDTTELHLSVSKEESDVLYDTAGMLIKEDEHKIKMRSHNYLFTQ